MDDREARILKADITEIKEAVRDVSVAVNDMRVLLAGNYVTKQDFEDYKKGAIINRRWWAGFIIALAGACVTIVSILWKV
jgi:hypothetical protein